MAIFIIFQIIILNTLNLYENKAIGNNLHPPSNPDVRSSPRD